MHNCLDFLEAWFAIVKVGAVFGPVNADFTGHEAAYVVGHSGAVAVICEPETAQRLDGRRDEVPALRDIILPTGGAGVTLEQLRNRGDAPPDVTPAGPEPAAVVYTSGTTGRPKGAVLSHANYISDARMFAEALPATAGDRMGMILPLFHVNAQVITTLTPLTIGASIVMWERFSVSTFWHTVERYQPVTVASVPTMLATLLHAPGVDEALAQECSLRYVICGAAPLSYDLLSRFERKFGLRILEGYGLTEGTCVSTLNPYYGLRKVGSIGLPLRGQEVNIVDDSGLPVGDGELGEIAVRGPNVMIGYLGDRESTDAVFRDGWLLTGDVGYRDEDGFLFIVDRKKDVIIRGGENVYPREVEEVLASHPSVREVSVIGVPDAIRGEEVHAVIELAPTADVSCEALEAFCRQRLARFKVPRSFDLSGHLPKTSTGKINRPSLRARFCETGGPP